ncbi:putative metal-binding motif-containing protein [Myxococcus sp. K15C18031901]|uniref:putative metal-binding motif-containing protein n=1 Tax=Myxococcus dinghuensis TaxID=2906761 RepID=UPI0020A6EEF4|nr:putative metal-binding motif-containing protein [Myxococcus dinghuensis]MCP3100665.1 putative metal-binding motif-containing protein [Myxococcus dinghuensis]
MRRLLWILPLLALAHCKKDVTQGAARLTVSYQGFKPGCIQVVARDVASEKEVSNTLEGKGDFSGGSVVVAVIPPLGWGDTLDVTARLFEQTCEGKPVGAPTTRVTVKNDEITPISLSLEARDADQDGYVSAQEGGTDCADGNAAIHPGAEERCNGQDDNCDGVDDVQAFDLGQACTVTAGCSGERRCGDDGKAYCDSPSALLAYPDNDEDGHGLKESIAEVFCNGVPAKYTQGLPDDCDDFNAAIHPGAPEFCDRVDTNCDGRLDEDFPNLDAACTTFDSQCPGTFACNAAKTDLVCVPSSTVPMWYPDEDGDGFGGNSGAVQSCTRPEGYVSQSGDCNDGNPATYPGAPELCDGVDNNCDGSANDNAVCPSGAAPGWVEKTVSSGGDRHWRTVTTWTKGGVWAGGEANRRARLIPSNNNFTVYTNTNCGASNTNWYASWSDPSASGRAWFGSDGGKKAYQDTGDTQCTQVHDDNIFIYGMVGIRTNGTLLFYGASQSSAANEGAAFTWSGTATPPTYSAPNNAPSPVYDIHGINQDTVFLAGGTNGDSGRIYRYSPGDGKWNSESVETQVSNLNRLNAVWVASPKVAFAVGRNGSVVRWNGAQWSRVVAPSTHELTSVIAFGAGSAYATCVNGHIYRYDGTSWATVHTMGGGRRLNDITGTGPDDLFAVGNDGRIVRWPAWP